MVLADVNTILKAENACDIFKNKNGIDGIKAQYKAYARKYHPDICHRNDIMTKVNVLYEKALSLVERGIWDEKNVYYIVDTVGRKFKLKYKAVYPFEFGMCYVGDNTLVYIFDNKYQKYYHNALDMIEKIKYQDKKMKDYFGSVMPNIVRYDKTSDGNYYIALSKKENVYPMSYVLKYFGGTLSPRHAAWVTTRLCNIVCFLTTCGIVHNGISIENLFVCPDTHTIYLYGGWWYSTLNGKKMIGLSEHVYKLLPAKAKKDKKSTFVTDIECVKNVCKTIIDKSSVNGFRSIKSWYNSVSKNPFENLDSWDSALTKQFGQRRFIKMEVNKNVLYSKH